MLCTTIEEKEKQLKKRIHFLFDLISDRRNHRNIQRILLFLKFFLLIYSVALVAIRQSHEKNNNTWCFFMRPYKTIIMKILLLFYLVIQTTNGRKWFFYLENISFARSSLKLRFFYYNKERICALTFTYVKEREEKKSVFYSHKSIKRT